MNDRRESFAAFECRPGKRHAFNYYSGWCAHGCGVRDDGRVVSRRGDVLHEGPSYTPDELASFRTRIEFAKG